MQKTNASIITAMVITAVLLFTTNIVAGTSFALKYSETFKSQQNQADSPCLIAGDPNMGTMVVQLRSDDEISGASTDECLEYVDVLIEKFGYKMFDVISWGDNEYTWTLN